MIRLILCGLYVFIHLLLTPFLFLFIWITGWFSKTGRDKFAFYCLKIGAKCLLFLSGAKVKVQGLENLPETPALYILNHRSIFDILVAYSILKTPTGFIAKKELSKIPLVAQWITINHGLFLDRKNVREGAKTILKGIQYLKSGSSICICPEGTRNKDLEDRTSLLPFHQGSFKLAEKANVPVVPMVFYGTEECFEAHKPFVRSTTIKVGIAPAVELSSLTKEEQRFSGDYFRNLMQDMMKEISK